MLRREWTVAAAAQLESAHDHYHALNPLVAQDMARRVWDATRMLAEHPERGHAGRVAGTREWMVSQTPYRLVYRVRDDVLQLLHVHLHTRDWLPRSQAKIERLEPWLAALISTLLHLAMVALLLIASRPIVTTPQGAAAGGRMKVDFLGDSAQPEPPAPASTAASSASSPVQSTLVKEAKDPVPPKEVKRASRQATPTPRPQPRPTPPQPDSTSTTRRQPQTWTGRPPGMLDEDISADDDGQGYDVSYERGRRNDRRASEPSMEVGGYQVYYDVHSETQLREWKAQGIREIAIILPGTTYRMVCPLEIALRRGSGKCRMVAVDSPELQAIGEARSAINMMEVYRRGEPVWRGPGPYR
jgi:plasmid stabilization system protein ParE